MGLGRGQRPRATHGRGQGQETGEGAREEAAAARAEEGGEAAGRACSTIPVCTQIP